MPGPWAPTNSFLLSLGTGFNPVTIPEGKAAHYELIDWGRYAVKELMNEANLQQNVIMQMIGQRPQTAPSPMSELVASGTASGVPSDAALSRLSQNMGAQKLVTYQRITVGLTRQRLDQLAFPTSIQSRSVNWMRGQIQTCSASDKPSPRSRFTWTC